MLKHKLNPFLKHPGMNKDGGGQTQTIQKADPWEAVQPYLKKGMNWYDQLFFGNAPASGTTAGTTTGTTTGSSMPAGWTQVSGGYKDPSGNEFTPGQLAGQPGYEWVTSGATQATGSTGGGTNSEPLGEFSKYVRNPYDKLASQNFAQKTAIDLIKERALNGSPVMKAMQSNLADTLSGKYLTQESNPYLSGAINAAMGDAKGMLNSQFNSPGAFGSTAHQGVMSKELGDIATKAYAQNYEQERQRQMQANLFAPQAAQADYMDAQQLANAGDAQQKYAQDLLNQKAKLWNEKRNYPLTAADMYMQRMQGAAGLGGTQTSTGDNPNASSGLANSLGGAMTGWSLGSNAIAPLFGATGLGADLWGGAGALLGLLGSDERMKTDIKKVGKTDSGLNVYTYRYKAGGPFQMGVMAQEVEKKKPEAVGNLGIGDFKGVRYGLIG